MFEGDRIIIIIEKYTILIKWMQICLNMVTVLCFPQHRAIYSHKGKLHITNYRYVRFTKTACFIQVNFKKSHTYLRNMREFVFQVVPKMNYDAFKEFSTFKKHMDK